MTSPLIYHFKTKSGNHYIYDACTDYVYPIEELDFQVIKNYKKYSYTELIDILGKKYPNDEISQSYQKISQWIKHDGAFFPKWPLQQEIKVPTQQEYERQLANLDKLTLQLTQQCNLRCKYCVYGGNYEFQRQHNISRMSWEVARKAIDYYLGLLNTPLRTRPLGATALSFYGGESLIEFRLMRRCVNYLDSRARCKMDYVLTTNGTLLSEKVCRFFIENNFLVYVSLDGPVKVHDGNRIFLNEKGSFRTISKNLQRLYKLDQNYYNRRVFFIVTYTPTTDLEQVLNFFSQKNNNLFYKKMIRANLVYLQG